MRNKHRILFRVALLGRIAWREGSEKEVIVTPGKSRTITLPAVIIQEIQQANQPIRISVESLEVYDIPAPDLLYDTRVAVLTLMPHDLHPLFSEIETKNDWAAWHDWEHRAVEAILLRATPIQTFSGARAGCPICGGSPDMDPGYTFPEGLTWHLTSRRPARRCTVMEVFFEWFRSNRRKE